MDVILRMSKPNIRKGTTVLYKRTEEDSGREIVLHWQEGGKITWQMLDYTIDYVEFCHEPIKSKLMKKTIKVGLAVAKRLPKCLSKKWKLLWREEPSIRHRFIHFHARGGAENKPVYGTMEHFACGAMCHLSRSDDLICKEDSKVQEKLAENTTKRVSIMCLFLEAWKEPYCLRDNNCIDYAIRCWNYLEPSNHTEIKYEDVAQVKESKDD